MRNEGASEATSPGGEPDFFYDGPSKVPIRVTRGRARGRGRMEKPLGASENVGRKQEYGVGGRAQTSSESMLR